MATPVDQKMLRQTKFPAEFNQKVDVQKINIEVMKKWIARRLSEILGTEDDVVTELCFNLLEGSRYPNIKELQIQLTGFLDKDTPKFCKDLWNLCLSAQSNHQGVPKELLEAKKQELIQEKEVAQRAAEAAQKQKESAVKQEQDLEAVRRRERDERPNRGRDHLGLAGLRLHEEDIRHTVHHLETATFRVELVALKREIPVKDGLAADPAPDHQLQGHPHLEETIEQLLLMSGLDHRPGSRDG
ncbi:hypothetical protein LTS08_002321 [Lithohypha guttulata]|nr:hypothetical protein LTS08_002321 [Lithohypha guttulata]